MFPRESTYWRLLIASSVLLLVFVSQSYWFMRAWSLAGRAKAAVIRVLLCIACMGAFGLLAVSFYLNFNFGTRNRPTWRSLHENIALTGVWLFSSLLAYLCVKFVDLAAWVWGRVARAVAAPASTTASPVDPDAALDNPERRRFVQGATIVAGTAPFAAGVYGFGFERLRFGVHRIDLPIANLPAALDGMTIAQLSDIHASNYMPAPEIRRAVDMANDLGADVTMVTGDFITGAGDPLEECIAELSRLHAPIGVWGCNGNHEIYAHVEAEAAELFERYGMRLLRQQNATLNWHGQPINLIGVDYQTAEDAIGRPRVYLTEIESLVRRDMPNILLSHNPNTFRRSAELGIELMLTGHTHGGQVRVEILHQNLSPARFMTPYIAGLYSRPLGAPSTVSDDDPPSDPKKPEAVLYVNRGLGTIGIPVRLGVPPEITLHTLRRA